ncbi:MAG: nitroreductase family protein [Spirochaetae bacterium HGW-Spirochaetae-1]|jgi:nitroreductase|nr:MAG: nitroreductase family protein [Spirochaetae bacterium HGW-Spirochaetae-1]
METNPVLLTIQNRRSRRRYTDTDLSSDTINAILEAGRWAPSGLNNQPWKFSIINNSEIKEKLAGLTKYSRIIRSCHTCIAVFYHIPSGYNRDKDIMSIGACIQNMLLAAESLHVGAVWLGEILNRKEEVSQVLNIDIQHELMAIISLGYSEEEPKTARKNLDDLMLNSYVDQLPRQK